MELEEQKKFVRGVRWKEREGEKERTYMNAINL
jgi:hypothetical protein